MCLYVDKKTVKLIKDKYCNGKKKIYGYKILTFKEGEYYSRIYPMKWEKETSNFISNRKSSKINSSEHYPLLVSSDGFNILISKGFHFYRTREYARARKRAIDPLNILLVGAPHIIKFEIGTKDVVAFDVDEETFVATKCKWLRRVR